MKIKKGSNNILTIEHWREFAPPKGGDRQWADDRSAKELARAWCGDKAEPCVPREVQLLLESHLDFLRPSISEVEPECEVALDKLFGEPRNSDLVGIGE